jgi:hypothetical protein
MAGAIGLDDGAQVIAGNRAQHWTVAKIMKVSLGIAVVAVGVPAAMRALGHSREPLAGATAVVQPAKISMAVPAIEPLALVAERAVPTPLADHGDARSKLLLPENSTKGRAIVRRSHGRAASAQRSNSLRHAASRPDPTLATAAAARNQPSPTDSSAQVATETVEAPPSAAAPVTPATPRERAHAASLQADRSPSAVEAPDAAAELELVERIYAALRHGKPSSALALCAEHERRWPHGAFAQEREGVRAIASCDMHSSQALLRARTFLASYPRAPLAPRVATACASQLSGPASNASTAVGYRGVQSD